MNLDGFIREARQVHGNDYDYSKTEYKNCKDKVCIICPRHGDFWQAPEKHLKRRQGCPMCGREKRARTNILKYGVENVFQNEDIKKKSRQTMVSRYGVPFSAQSGLLQEKCETTMLERYGVKNTLESDDLRAKVDDTMLERYGEACPMHCPEIVERFHATCTKRYGNPYPAQNPDISRKGFEARKTNGTAGSSGPEEEMYQVLCEKFGETDVVRNYGDDRYPFHCDFYIRPKDLFIELNACWTHGFHFFDRNSEADRDKLSIWIEKAADSMFYRQAIHVWTVSDVLKRETALRNHINYIVFWKNDLSDFYAWIHAFE